MSDIELELEAIRERDRAEWAARSTRDCVVCGRWRLEAEMYMRLYAKLNLDDAERGEHRCLAYDPEEGKQSAKWRPCPASCCEADVLQAELENLRYALLLVHQSPKGTITDEAIDAVNAALSLVDIAGYAEAEDQIHRSRGSREA